MAAIILQNTESKLCPVPCCARYDESMLCRGSGVLDVAGGRGSARDLFAVFVNLPVDAAKFTFFQVM